MADLRIQYTERMVGNGSPTYTDTLNRQISVEHNNDGTHGPSSFSGSVIYNRGTTIVSAPTISIPADGSVFYVSGNANISAINSNGLGNRVVLIFLGSLTLSSSATLILPNGGADISIGINDVCTFYEYTLGNWVLVSKSSSSTGFGSWAGPLTNNVNVQATTDLMVHAYGVNTGGTCVISGFTDNTTTPTTKIVYTSGATNVWLNVTMAVKKGDYWKINVVGTAATIYTLSLGL